MGDVVDGMHQFLSTLLALLYSWLELIHLGVIIGPNFIFNPRKQHPLVEICPQRPLQSLPAQGRR
jgi:hypothetical protein